MTGKKLRPSTEPMYSEGNIRDFPITSGYHESVGYTDFISSYVKNSKNILICQSVCNGTLSGCFAPSKMYSPTRPTSWGFRDNYDSFLEFVRKKWKLRNGKSQNIYSLACDENKGFGVFFVQNYGTSQTIVKNTSHIKEKWQAGFKITACAAQGSTFYVIMTKDTEEYEGKLQSWFTCSTWAEAQNKIEEKYEEGKVITGICYSTVLDKYFIVMTETTENQTYKWFYNYVGRSKWISEQYKEGFHVTIIFKDPIDDNILVVMTTDKNRSGYKCRFNYKLK